MTEIPGLGSRYDLEEELPANDLLRRFRARDRESGTGVVVKALRRDAASPRVLGMLQSAVAMQRSLGGRPHSPLLVEAGQVDEPADVAFYVVRELVAGHDLGKAFREGEPPMPFDVSRDVLAELAAYVVDLESLGFRHGGLTPSNVVLTDDGEVVVLDPGMAPWLLAPGEGLPADAGARRFVAPGYLDPPYFEDVRGDQFSIAAIVDGLLAPLEVKGASSLGARVERFRKDVLARALAVAPDDRYPSAKELAAAAEKAPKAAAAPKTSDAADARALLARLDRADHYGILGVVPESSFDSIREAYFALFTRFHPTRASEPGMAEVKDELAQISNRLGEIYATLRDPVARSAYDERIVYQKRRQSHGTPEP